MINALDEFSILNSALALTRRGHTCEIRSQVNAFLFLPHQPFSIGQVIA